MSDRYEIVSDLPEWTVHDNRTHIDLFPTRSGNRNYACKFGCTEQGAKFIANALNSQSELLRLRKIIDGMECFCGDWIGKCPPCKAKLEADKNTELEKLIDSAKCPECDGCGFTVMETGGCDMDGENDTRESVQVKCQWCAEKNDAKQQAKEGVCQPKS